MQKKAKIGETEKKVDRYLLVSISHVHTSSELSEGWGGERWFPRSPREARA